MNRKGSILHSYTNTLGTMLASGANADSIRLFGASTLA
jgi:hypothetical protein